MSFNLSGSTTPAQPAIRPLYPSFNLQTPATPTPSTATGNSGSQPLQSKPPPRPASVPLSFGGLSHSASTPSLSQTLNQPPQQQQSQPLSQGFSSIGQQPFSPAPQPPLTTYDLSNSPFQKPQGQWGMGQIGGQTLTRSHSQQFMPLNQNPLGERRYLPSHLRSYSPERSSPLAKDSSAANRDTGPSPKEKRRVSFGSVTTFGNPSVSNFGGSGFGTPKDDGKVKNKREDDDLPPSASIYDFTRSPYTKDAPRSPSPPPDITPSLFSSTPSSSPSKRQDPTPVILFGFPSAHAPLIIREYEKYGPILEHFSSNHPLLPTTPLPPQEILQGGNWIRITYADPVSAARAVATNGTLIGGAYMIGVIYAPKPAGTTTIPEAQSGNEGMDLDQPSSRRREERQGEKKMNVVKGQSMFVKKEVRNENVGWGQWVWNVLGVDHKKETSLGGGGFAGGNISRSSAGMGSVGGGQSNVVVRALKGLSETVFGF